MGNSFALTRFYDDGALMSHIFHRRGQDVKVGIPKWMLVWSFESRRTIYSDESNHLLQMLWSCCKFFFCMCSWNPFLLWYIGVLVFVVGLLRPTRIYCLYEKLLYGCVWNVLTILPCFLHTARKTCWAMLQTCKRKLRVGVSDVLPPAHKICCT
jgi:hypothetical protein